MAAVGMSARAQSDTPSRPGMLARFWHEFNYIDTTYVDPNRYNWEAMVEASASQEWLALSGGANGGRGVSLSPDALISVGPYIGWRWIFLGYKFALNDNGAVKSRRREFELSLYGSMLGCDLIYRRTGDDFKWRSAGAAGIADGGYSGGVTVETIGGDAYYVFNHRRFSLPSLFAQSTVQRRSQGSWLLGASVTRHKYRFDMRGWPEDAHILEGGEVASFSYLNIALSGGYGYNWVLRRGVMLGFSLMPAIGYKRVSGGNSVADEGDGDGFVGWMGRNLNVDVTGRAALVWNTGRHYAGISLIVHNYNFSREGIGIHNTFGSLNVYVGLNFGKRKEYRF